MQNLPRERITIGVTALAIAEQAFADTLAYCKERTAFGQPIGTFQHSKFALAEMATEIAVAREFTDRAIMEHCADRLSTDEASMAKWWNTELCNRVTDQARATARRVRLYARLPGRPCLGRQPRAVDLRRHHRDPEGNHRPRPRPVA